VVALQSLQNDQVAIAGLKVEVNDLKNVVDHIMDMVVPQVAGEEPKRDRSAHGCTLEADGSPES
jgi:hypothetical protein